MVDLSIEKYYPYKNSTLNNQTETEKEKNSYQLYI